MPAIDASVSLPLASWTRRPIFSYHGDISLHLSIAAIGGFHVGKSIAFQYNAGGLVGLSTIMIATRIAGHAFSAWSAFEIISFTIVYDGDYDSSAAACPSSALMSYIAATVYYDACRVRLGTYAHVASRARHCDWRSARLTSIIDFDTCELFSPAWTWYASHQVAPSLPLITCRYAEIAWISEKLEWASYCDDFFPALL